MEVPGLAGGSYVAGEGMKERSLGLSGRVSQWGGARGAGPVAPSHPVRLVGRASARRTSQCLGPCCCLWAPPPPPLPPPPTSAPTLSLGLILTPPWKDTKTLAKRVSRAGECPHW